MFAYHVQVRNSCSKAISQYIYISLYIYIYTRWHRRCAPWHLVQDDFYAITAFLRLSKTMRHADSILELEIYRGICGSIARAPEGFLAVSLTELHAKFASPCARGVRSETTRTLGPGPTCFLLNWSARGGRPRPPRRRKSVVTRSSATRWTVVFGSGNALQSKLVSILIFDRFSFK